MSEWVVGRAGMLYRDLVPDRLGGLVIASHIRIPDAGPVPDWVHWHGVRFQTIYCHRGWVRVVYEDQGDPIVLEPGDCVLQPPGIRHRVLESSAGLEVVEVTSPSDHQTHADDARVLPTVTLDPDRTWSGQRFVYHRAARATWHAHAMHGFEARDTGIADATGGLASVQVLRPSGTRDTSPHTHDDELLFFFVLAGSVTLQQASAARVLALDDAVAVPAGIPFALVDPSADLALLEVRLLQAGAGSSSIGG